MAPLTRNLYREDEVVAAFKWCAIKGRAEDAIFWATELLDSDMRPHLWEAMLWVWALAVGVTDPYWLDRFAFMNGPVEDTQILTTVMALLRNPAERRDATAVALLGLGLGEACLADFVGQPPMPTFSQGMTGPAVTAAAAIIQGKTAFAWGLLRGLWDSERVNAWAILTDCAPARANWIHFLAGQADRFPSLRWPLRAAALCIAVYDAPRAPVITWTPPAEWVAYAEGLKGLTHRKRRTKEIPQSALFLFTERGWRGVCETGETELMDIRTLEECLTGSVWWGAKAASLDTDDGREAFYDTWFPDDIPDEWPTAARRVSHGGGALPTGGPPDYRVMLRAALTRWFGTLPTKVWDGLATGIAELVARWPEEGNRLVKTDTAFATLYEGEPPALPKHALVAAFRRLQIQ